MVCIRASTSKYYSASQRGCKRNVPTSSADELMIGSQLKLQKKRHHASPMVKRGVSAVSHSWRMDLQCQIDKEFNLYLITKMFMGCSNSLYVAAHSGNLEEIPYVTRLSYATINDPVNENGETLIYIAAKYGHIEVVKFLIRECRADVNKERTDNGGTPLITASQNGHLDIVKLLVCEGHANVNHATKDQRCTSLFMATLNGHLEVVRFLACEAGAVVDQATSNSCSPLHIAAQIGNLDIAKCLVNEAGATSCCQMFDGSTPLHIASFYGNFEVLMFLVRKGCGDTCMHQEDNAGNTPMRWVCQQGHLDICTRLLVHGVSVQMTDFIDRPALRGALLSWVDGQLAKHESFVNIVLASMRRGTTRISALDGFDHVKTLIADFADVQHGRELSSLRSIRPAIQRIHWKELEELAGCTY
uniref:Uncharacterized protein n=1 Tax=Octactis speculum TaxID=3111310 RepID=A0A7S2BT43_9STRA|mmetsp:Transcript_26915/g.36979  ORF Transcript_26915/g.36979 Transcript_26915/m.36979 type:complete len:416 (+) Transcript_26915:77-1324(+)